MNLLAVTCMYDRPKVSEVFLKNMDRLGIVTLAAVSDNESGEVCRDNRVPNIFVDNAPLGNKWNQAIRKALSLRWTHLLITGDDDLFTEEFLQRVEENSHHPFIGIESCYMVKPSTKQAIEYRYNKDKPLHPFVMGGGRVLRREVVEAAGDMYIPDRNNNLEHYADIVLLEHCGYPVVIDSDKPLCVSLKTGRNIWGFENFVNNKEAKAVEYEQAVGILVEEERRMVDGLQ